MIGTAIVVIKEISFSVGMPGTYLGTDGLKYAAEVIGVHEVDPAKCRLHANTGLSLIPAQSIDILLTKDGSIVHNPDVAVAIAPKLVHTFVPSP